MNRRGLGVLLFIVMFGAVSSAALAHAPTTYSCRTFTGPGDNLVHSKNFRVADIRCGQEDRRDLSDGRDPMPRCARNVAVPRTHSW